MIITTDAIVLHSRRFGDTSRIVVLYSKDLGKVSVVAKGVRTTKSKLGSALEPLSICTATIYYAASRELHTISNAELIEPFSALRTGYNKLTTAIAVCETVIKTQSVAEPNTDVYELLARCLYALTASNDEIAFSIGLGTRIQLAEIMGFGLPVPTSYTPDALVVFISLFNGTVRNHSGSSNQNDAIRMSSNAWQHLHAALLQKPALGYHIAANDADVLELESFLSLYFSHHLSKRITSNTYQSLL